MYFYFKTKTDEALAFDLKVLADFGMNFVRLHQKGQQKKKGSNQSSFLIFE